MHTGSDGHCGSDFVEPPAPFLRLVDEVDGEEVGEKAADEVVGERPVALSVNS